MGSEGKEPQQEKQVYQQDLSKEEQPGAVFVMTLLFREPVDIPEKQTIAAAAQKHLGEVDCFWCDEKGAGIAVKKYLCEFKDASVPPQLMLTPCNRFDEASIDEFEKSQMWDCKEDKDRILTECRYKVAATDMMAAALPANQRAELDMDWLDTLMELYPTCEAVYFFNSGKLIRANDIRNYRFSRESRFIKFAVNVRFFTIQGTDDMIVDTRGMSTLFMPDLQYHFHGMDPNWVVNHAYNTASYMLDHDNPIQAGDPIDGVENGKLSVNVQWRCNYENALIQPARTVIDIYMNEYAAGTR